MQVLKLSNRLRVVFLMTLLVLSACSKHFKPNDPEILPSRVAGATDANVINLQKLLRKYRVKVVTIGQEYMVSIPASVLFADQSPRILWSSHIVLDTVVRFLRQFRKVEVHVSAYTSRYKSVRREKALALARAKAVANYIYHEGTDTRFIFMRGIGSDKPIGIACGQGDEVFDARIEINFREAIR